MLTVLKKNHYVNNLFYATTSISLWKENDDESDDDVGDKIIRMNIIINYFRKADNLDGIRRL